MNKHCVWAGAMALLAVGRIAAAESEVQTTATAASVGAPTARPMAGQLVESPPADVAPEPRMAFAVNPPFRWQDGDSVAASLYIGLAEHHALRLNAATYTPKYPLLFEVAVGITGGDGPEASYSGRTTDVGASWIWFPRRLYDGFSVEVGALRRARDTTVHDTSGPNEYVATDTTLYAGRAMAGWSWLMYQRVFVSLQLGLSAGYQSGGKTLSNPLRREPPMTVGVDSMAIEPEGWLRIGVVFDR